MVSLKDLQENFKGVVSQPGDQEYDISRWSAAAEKRARFVLFPKNKEDISLAVRFAVAEKLDLAISGGRHGTLGQSSSEGVVIDMRKYLNGICVDALNKLVNVQGGCCIAKLEEETIKHGLSVVTGVSSDVGVVGHLLGGGYGLSVGMHGLGVDNIVSATVVIADGSIIFADENENSDLFWAIRGGGSNFGVVVEVKLKLHDQRPDAFVADMAWPREKLPEIVEEINRWRPNQPINETVCLLFVQPPSGKPIIAMKAFKISDRAEGEAAFKRFVSLGPVFHNPRQVPWEKLCTMADEIKTQRCAYIAQGAFINHLRLQDLEKLWNEWMNVVTTTPASSSCVMFEFYHCLRLSQVPVDATAYACRTQDIPVLIAGGCPDLAAWNAERVKRDMLRLKDIIESQYSPDEGGKLPQTHICGYPNYADSFAIEAESDEYVQAVFGKNYHRLQRIKKKYDPNMVFNKWFPIRPEN